MSFSNFFTSRTGQQPPVQQSAEAQPTGQQTQTVDPSSVGGNPATVDPNNQQQTQQSEIKTGTETSPLDKFTKLWQTNATNSSEPKRYVNVDQAKLSEATSKLNFASAIKPEQLQAIAQGGEAAVTAFQEAINAVSQQLFQTAMLGSSRLMEQALQNSKSDMLAEVPGMLKHQMSMQSMQEKNPGVSHPAVLPLIEAMQAQFAAQHPEASPSELRQLAEDYLVNAAGLISGNTGPSQTATRQSARDQNSASVDSIDWGKDYFNFTL